MAHGFASPIEALDQIEECLGEWPVPNTRIHKGSEGSGLGLDCCPALVRIESQSVRPDAVAGRGNFAVVGNCKPLEMTVTVKYRECWVAQDNTKSGKAPEQYASVGANVILGWWTALERLSCCKPSNQLLTFVDVTDYPPDGCIGWDMQIIALVSFCGCSGV